MGRNYLWCLHLALCLIYWSNKISIGLCSILYNVQSFDFLSCLEGVPCEVCKEFDKHHRSITHILRGSHHCQITLWIAIVNYQVLGVMYYLDDAVFPPFLLTQQGESIRVVARGNDTVRHLQKSTSTNWWKHKMYAYPQVLAKCLTGNKDSKKKYICSKITRMSWYNQTGYMQRINWVCLIWKILAFINLINKNCIYCY